MQNLGLILATLYPNAVPLVDYSVQQDRWDTDPYIVYWNETKLGPRPKDEVLLAAEAEVLLKVEARKKIIELENGITNRRLREAVLTGDKTWLQAQENAIANERLKLK